MATIIKQATNFSKDVYKGGMGNGLKTGVVQGLLGVFLHQFFARVIGGVISASMTKNTQDKRTILLESTKEGVYQLIAGE